MQTASEVKKEFDSCKTKESLDEFIKKYCSDERKSIQKILNSANKKIAAAEKENNRLLEMCRYENKYYDDGAKYIAGIDEVGRGPLAGPVMTAAVILPKGFVYEGINDSKKLSAKKREELYDVIMENAVEVSIKLESNIVIDEINILNATKKAMANSLNSLKIKPDIVLVDAVTIPGIGFRQEAMIKGDAKSISIAAASIVAKVTRDRIMADFAKVYPEYGFEKNSGYGTAEHIEAIKKYGICPIHRKSFLKKYVEE